MAKLILHIGMHKTGTSTLQMALHKASKQKKIHNFNYLTVRQANHSYITTAAFSSNENIPYYKFCKTINSNSNGIMPKGNWDKTSAQKTIRQQIKRTIEEDKDLVISAEDLCILTPNEVTEMKSFFISCGISDFKIIAYIRDPQSWAVSYAQQVLKQGLQTIEEILQTPSIPRYKEFFQKYIDTFGIENCNFIPFDREDMINNCIISDFLINTNLLTKDELETTIDNISIPNSNESVNLVTLQAISFIIKSKSEGLKISPGLIGTIRKNLKNLDSQGFYFPESSIKKITNQSSDDVDWMKNVQNTINPEFFDKKVQSLSEDIILKDIDNIVWLTLVNDIIRSKII